MYFDDKQKDAECIRYPRLSHMRCFHAQVPFFISKAIEGIAKERREKFSVLIIAPTKNRCRSVSKALKEKGLDNITYVDQQTDKSITLIECFSILADDAKSNLGWNSGETLFGQNGT